MSPEHLFLKIIKNEEMNLSLWTGIMIKKRRRFFQLISGQKLLIAIMISKLRKMNPSFLTIFYCQKFSINSTKNNKCAFNLIQSE